MSTALLIYLYITVGKIVIGLVVTASIALVIYAFSVIIFGLNSNFGTDGGETPDTDSRMFFKAIAIRKKMIWLLITTMFLYSGYPSKEDLVIIIGGSALVSVAQTEEAKKLPDNILSAANRFLEGVYEDDSQNQTAAP